MDAISKAYAGKDRKTRRRYNAIFNRGFTSGAKARVASGIALPPGHLPKRSATMPPEFTVRNERTVWSSGWRMGYAIGTPRSNSKNEIEYRRQDASIS